MKGKNSALSLVASTMVVLASLFTVMGCQSDTATSVPAVPTATPVPAVPTATPVPAVPAATPMPAASTATPVPAVPTATPVPATSTVTLMPIEISARELMNAYGSNKLSADTRYHYDENGGIPLMVTGYIAVIERDHMVLKPRPSTSEEQAVFDIAGDGGVYCYYGIYGRDTTWVETFSKGERITLLGIGAGEPSDIYAIFSAAVSLVDCRPA